MTDVTEFKDFKTSQILKHITVSERNYYALKRLGHAGDSFNDVVDKLLEDLEVFGRTE